MVWTSPTSTASECQGVAAGAPQKREAVQMTSKSVILSQRDKAMPTKDIHPAHVG